MSGDERVTAIRVIAATSEGRNFECFQIVHDWGADEPTLRSAAVRDAVEDSGAELVQDLVDRGLA